MYYIYYIVMMLLLVFQWSKVNNSIQQHVISILNFGGVNEGTGQGFGAAALLAVPAQIHQRLN